MEPGDAWEYRVRRADGPHAPLVDDHPVVVRVVTNWPHGRRRVAVVERSHTVEPGGGVETTIEFQVIESTGIRITDDPVRLDAMLDAPLGASTGENPATSFVFPIRPGLRWGEPEMLARQDGLYTASVGERTRVTTPFDTLDAWPVEYRTLPDQETRWVAPSIGVVRRDYVHHGLDQRELWDLTRFVHAAVDTAAFDSLLADRLRLILSSESVAGGAARIATDPVVRALHGATAETVWPGDEDGVRRRLIRGEQVHLSVERIPDGPSRAWLVEWRIRGQRARGFALSGAGDVAPVTAGGSFIPLEAIRASLVDARRRSGEGDRAGAAAAASSATTTLVAALCPLAASYADFPATPEQWRRDLRPLLPSGALITRYGRRVRIDDRGLRIDIEPAGDRLGVTARFQTPDGASVGGAPQLIDRSGGARALENASSDIGPLARRWLTLDWVGDRPGLECLVVGEGDGGETRWIEYDEVDADGVHAGWSRRLAGGTARLTEPGSLLEIVSEEPDPTLPVATRHWRESFAPPDAAGGLAPTPLFRERLDPWLDPAVAVIAALRRGEDAGPWVRGDDLLARLRTTWLASPSQAIDRIASVRWDEGGEPDSPVASVTVYRRRSLGNAEVESDRITLRLIRERGAWRIVDFVSGSHEGGDLGP